MSSVDSSDSYEQDVEQFMELSFANLLCASQFLHDSQLLASVLSPALQNDDDLLYLYGAAADSFREYNWKGMYTKNPKQDPKYHYIKQKYFPPADSQHNDYQLPVGRRSYNQMWLEKCRVTREEIGRVSIILWQQQRFEWCIKCYCPSISLMSTDEFAW